MWLWDRLDAAFFGDASEASNGRGALLRVLRYPYAITRDLLASGEITLRAMSLVFATLLAMIPMLAFAFALLRGFGPHKALQPIVEDFFRPLGADAPQITAYVMQFAERVRNSLVGVLGFVLLTWSLMSAIKKVEDSFNFVWRVEQARSFVRRIAEYLALLLIGPALVVGFVTLMRKALASEPVHLFSQLPLGRELLAIGVHTAPYVAATVLFTILYVLVPNTRVRLLPALIGGLCAGLAWAAVGKIFTSFVMHSTRLTLVYASFAVVIALPTWTYLSWLILLAGAQLSFYVQNPSYLRIGLAELRLSCLETERLALKLACVIAQAALVHERGWSNETLAARFGLPGIVVSRVTEPLVHAGILRLDEAQHLALTRDPSSILVQDVLRAVREQAILLMQRKLPFALPVLHLPAVDALSERLEESWRRCCGQQTLRELALASEATPRRSSYQR